VGTINFDCEVFDQTFFKKFAGFGTASLGLHADEPSQKMSQAKKERAEKYAGS
jgi:hypothetical protein